MAALFRTLELYAGLAVLTACSETPNLAPLKCQPISVLTREGPLTGIEDMAHLGGGVIALSAYNRRAPNKAPVGLFSVRVDTGQNTWQVTRLLDMDKGTYPHGLSLSDDGVMALIVRREGGPPRLGLYAFNDEGAPTFQRWLIDDAAWADDIDYPCNMNDVTFADSGDILVTNDRAACGGIGRLVDNVFARSSGSVLSVSHSGAIEVLEENLFFPNGIADADEGTLVVALTRAKELAILGSDARWSIAGAPDNITLADGAGAWIATIPSLPKYALYQRGLNPGTLPSRAIHFDLKEARATAYETLAYEGATTVLEVGDHLILSGAFTSGLARCERPDV